VLEEMGHQVAISSAYEWVEYPLPALIFIHNILCLPIHPAATAALINVLKKTNIPRRVIHHDI
jgi:hypothetical protein